MLQNILVFLLVHSVCYMAQMSQVIKPVLLVGIIIPNTFERVIKQEGIISMDNLKRQQQQSLVVPCCTKPALVSSTM